MQIQGIDHYGRPIEMKSIEVGVILHGVFDIWQEFGEWF